MSELSKLFPNGFVRLPNWLSAEQKNFMLRAMSDYEALLSENQRLTAIATKHATRCDELYGVLECICSYVSEDGLITTGLAKEIVNAQRLIDKARTEADK